jgi:predicted MFS family arabinose efflux permease
VRRIALVVVGLAVAFVLGIALGQSLDDNSDSSGTQTIVRTLKPLALAPAARQTVTITVSNR